jgi:hypothetical protein
VFSNNPEYRKKRTYKMLSAELPSESASRIPNPKSDKSITKNDNKPATTWKTRKQKTEPEYKPSDLVSCGFVKFLDEPSTTNTIKIPQTDNKPQLTLENNSSNTDTTASLPQQSKPFFHTTNELPKIRQQNLKNYSDLKQYPRATDARVAEYFPQLDEIIANECAKVGQYGSGGQTSQDLQHAKIRRFYGYIRDDISRILIHRFIRPIPHHNKEYYYRLALEFRLIKQKTFTKVFLQVLDILGLLDPAKTPHVIRGSAGSCLVCYLLGITASDPIAENISLARFMHAARDDLPDIDMDFPHNQRDEIYARIFATWPQRVARISNHVAYGAKTALKKIMKEHGVRTRIPKDFELTDYFTDVAEIEEIQAAAEELEGQFKHFSLHCGGIVIFEQAVPQEYYLQEIRASKSREPTAPNSKTEQKEVLGIQINLNKDQVDDYAFIKIDILSNRGLSQLWDISNKPLLEYPPADSATLKALSDGRNIGLTYAESRAIGKALRHLQPTGIHDIATALAIIRPAASANGQKMDFLRDLSNIRAGNTASIDRDYIIYDDDAIQTINRILDCGESQADIYRKAFAKRKFKLIKEFRDRLDLRRRDWSVAKRDAICDQLACLQDYSFCKSHALSYARLVYALAYQKTHNPVQFWLSALNNCQSSYRSWVHFREAVAAGCQLSPGRGPWQISTTNPRLIQSMYPSTDTNSANPQTPDTQSQTSNPEYQIACYFRHGFWPGQEFLPGMYHNVYHAEPLVNVASKKAPTPIMVHECEFRGLIATYRICKTDRHSKKYTNGVTSTTGLQPSTPITTTPAAATDAGQSKNKKDKWITFVTLGIADGRYIDIVLYGAIRLGKCHVIEGEGYWMNNAPENSLSPWIKVKKWRSRYLAPTYPDD